jgi:pyruvate formate lyase activating enzyme
VTTVRLGGIEDISTVDWYGKMATVFFLAGCNYRCPMCYNGTLLDAKEGMLVNIDVIRRRITENAPIIDGIVLTGGEPTLQAYACIEICRLAKQHDLPVMLDTNGSKPHVVEYLASKGLIQRIALDIKSAMNPVDYPRAAGVKDINVALKVFHTLKIAKKYNIPLEARTTIVPELSDDIKQIRAIGYQLAYYADEYHLQQFDPTNALDPELRSCPFTKKSDLEMLAFAARGGGFDNVFIKTKEDGLEHAFKVSR